VIEIQAPSDGGNPQDPAAIRRLGDGHIRVSPFSEDGDANYKFALHVEARNTDPAAAPLTLEVDWGDQVYTPSRRFVHVGREGAWQFLPAQVDGSMTLVQCDVPPGRTAIGLSPAYGLADYRGFEADLVGTAFRRESLGRNEQGREIAAFHLGGGPQRILITARVHPYETAASFCVEGAMRWLAGGDAAAEELLRAAHVVVVPMPNPDGVYAGLCKRTAVGGVDLTRESVGSGDGAAQALLRLVEDWRPTVYLDLYGWMHWDEDGWYALQDGVGDGFQRAAAEYPALAANRWKGALERPSATAIRSHCLDRFGTRTLEVSYRWPGRTVDQMREIGAATMQAVPALF